MSAENNNNTGTGKQDGGKKNNKGGPPKEENNNTPQPCIILFVKPNDNSRWMLCARTFKIVESAESYAKINYGDVAVYTVDVELPQ